MMRRAIFARPRAFSGVARGVSTNSQATDNEITAPMERKFKRWEKIRPLSCTSQEKHLVDMIRKAEEVQQLVVVFNFRGIRKTVTAERVAFCSSCPFLYARSCWWLLRYRVVHIREFNKLARIDRHLGDGSVVEILLEFANNHFLVGVVAMLLAVINWFFLDKEQKEKTSLLEQVKDAFGMNAAEIVLLVLVLVSTLVARRPVYIVDDVLSFTAKRGKTTEEMQRILDDLKRAAQTRTIILLSSNEGLPELFSDKNASTFITGSFVRATSKEFVRAHNLFIPNRPISSTDFQGICESFGMEHHVYSMRWYPYIPDHEFARMMNPGKATGPVLSRNTLRIFALRLDLECEKVSGAYALAYSQVVDVRASLKGYFTEAEIETVVKEYGATGPRRLVLTAALLVTGRSAALRGLAQEAANKLAAAKKVVPQDDALIEKSKAYLEAVQKNIEKASEPLGSQEDLDENNFFTAVRQVLEQMRQVGEKRFVLDVRCVNELDRITPLLFGEPPKANATSVIEG